MAPTRLRSRPACCPKLVGRKSSGPYNLFSVISSALPKRAAAKALAWKNMSSRTSVCPLATSMNLQSLD